MPGRRAGTVRAVGVVMAGVLAVTRVPCVWGTVFGAESGKDDTDTLRSQSKS